MVVEQPTVTVIIPNYNHARYLPLRIESVLKQSFQDFEVIILDDCSTDNSREIIDQYASLDTRIQVLYNSENGGSTFSQWNKGIALAAGRYIWLAESDDYADAAFLETLVAKVEADPAISLAYCDSWNVDENGIIKNKYGDFFYQALNPHLWTDDFVMDGLELVLTYMSRQNVIPNASAVVLRKETVNLVSPADPSFKVNGDWLYWSSILAISKVAFVAKPLNYFRHHTNNARSPAVISGRALLEALRVLNKLQQYGPMNELAFNKTIDGLLNMWFTSFIRYTIPLAVHRQIYLAFKEIYPGFAKLIYDRSRKFLFSNKFSGLRQVLGDGLVYKYIRKK